MISSLKQAACGAALILALAGCGGPVISRIDAPVPNRFEAYFSGMAAGRDLFVTVRGTPFGGNERDFASKVAGMIVTPAWLPKPERIVTLAEPDPLPPFRVVLLFGTPYEVSGREACRHERSAPVVHAALPPGSTITVQGAVCLEDSFITEAEGWVRDVSGPDDPRFHALISQLSDSLMPQQRNISVPHFTTPNTR